MNIPFEQAACYKKGRSGGGKIEYLVIHAMQGTYQGTIEWFKNPKCEVSAHYLVSRKGDVLQMVKETDTAWAVCNANYFCLNIEHEDQSNGPINPKTGSPTILNCLNNPQWMTISELDSSVKLAADICKRYAIPVSKIIGHNDPFLKRYGNNHVCPGPYMDMSKYRIAVQKELDSGSSQ